MFDCNVLIIEGNPILAFALQREFLRRRAFILGVFDTGEAALDFLHALPAQPLLIVCDYSLSGRLDGLQIAEIFLRREAAYFVLTNTLRDPQRMAHLLEHRHFRSLPKPFSEARLHGICQKLIAV